jgi:hypothetical protein
MSCFEGVIMNAKVLASFLLITTGALSTHASASVVVYTETADITGSLNGVAFTDSVLTLTMTADTSSIAGSAPIFTLIAPLDFTLAGVGSGVFTDEVQAVANQTRPLAGFGDNSNGEGLLFTLNAAFAAYDLSTSVGPLSGEAIINAGTSFGTSGGAFVINSVSGGDATFAASVGSAIPEASTWGMLLLGFASLGFLGVRSRKAAPIAA